jgi:hypothetical protein
LYENLLYMPRPSHSSRNTIRKQRKNLPSTLYNVFLPVLQFSPVTTIPSIQGWILDSWKCDRQVLPKRQ